MPLFDVLGFFKKNKTNGVSVTKENKFIGSLCAYDFLQLMVSGADLSALNEPVEYYLPVTHSTVPKPVLLPPDSSLLSVIKNMGEHHAHCVYFTPDWSSENVIGLTACSDLIGFFSSVVPVPLAT
jgi:CBS domain-containing protein